MARRQHRAASVAVYFSSPQTGFNYNKQYEHPGLEVDLPATEGTCNTETKEGCTVIPTTDRGTPAAFYPFSTTSNTAIGCAWAFGNNLPGQIGNFRGGPVNGSRRCLSSLLQLLVKVVS